MAETVTAREANQHFSRLLREVAEGQSFVITHRGRPVARLVRNPPQTTAADPGQQQAFPESIATARRQACPLTARMPR